MVAISLKGLVKYILKFMFFIPTKPKTFNTTIIFYGNNFLTYHLLWYYVHAVSTTSIVLINNLEH